jgi:hypothetical protein
MTTKSKTGDRLVASVRRTKETAQDTKSDQAATTKPSTPRKTAAAGDKSPQRSRASKKPSKSQDDSYQSQGRVWPD